MDVRVIRVAEAHDGLVPWSALLAEGMGPKQAARTVARLRRLHDGVFVTGHGRVTAHQRRLAGTLTAPGTALSHASAAAHWGFRRWHGEFETVIRPGSGGPRRCGALLISRSATLDGHLVSLDGIRMTSVGRTLVDLSAHLTVRQRDKAVREAIRLRRITALELRLVAAEHSGRRGTAGLEALAARFESLPLARTRSDAEARALEVLATAGVALPAVNVRIAGEEADLVWAQSRRIVEIDGPQFHQDPVEDARKTGIWEADGWRVERIGSDVVFDAPEVLVALARRCERPTTAS